MQIIMSKVNKQNISLVYSYFYLILIDKQITLKLERCPDKNAKITFTLSCVKGGDVDES